MESWKEKKTREAKWSYQEESFHFLCWTVAVLCWIHKKIVFIWRLNLLVVLVLLVLFCFFSFFSMPFSLHLILLLLQLWRTFFFLFKRKHAAAQLSTIKFNPFNYEILNNNLNARSSKWTHVDMMMIRRWNLYAFVAKIVKLKVSIYFLQNERKLHTM